MAGGQNLVSSVLTTAQPHSLSSRPQASPLQLQKIEKSKQKSEKLRYHSQTLSGKQKSSAYTLTPPLNCPTNRYHLSVITL
jgi:hypothetical protein